MGDQWNNLRGRGGGPMEQLEYQLRGGGPMKPLEYQGYVKEQQWKALGEGVGDQLNTLTRDVKKRRILEDRYIQYLVVRAWSGIYGHWR